MQKAVELIEIKKHLLDGARSADKERGKGLKNVKGDRSCVEYVSTGDGC